MWSCTLVKVIIKTLNPLTPRSDQERISPYNIIIIIIIIINYYNIKKTSDENKGKYPLGIISWRNTNFSKVTS